MTGKKIAGNEKEVKMASADISVSAELHSIEGKLNSLQGEVAAVAAGVTAVSAVAETTQKELEYHYIVKNLKKIRALFCIVSFVLISALLVCLLNKAATSSIFITVSCQYLNGIAYMVISRINRSKIKKLHAETMELKAEKQEEKEKRHD